MDNSFRRFGGISAILVGLLSLAYALFYLVIARQSEALGIVGSWVILAVSGLFSSAAYVALYERLRPASEGFALWALLLGVAASFATLAHGAYETLLLLAEPAAGSVQAGAIAAAQQLPSQVDPAGLASFFVVGVVAFIFSWLIVRSALLPRTLGYLGLFNALLLVVLYFASAANAQTLILISGGLTSVLAGPIWWIWLGRQLLRGRTAVAAGTGPRPVMPAG
jgi:hypothetical protein